MSQNDKIIRIPGENMQITETNEEIDFRQNTYHDFKEVLKKKLCCTVCNKQISRNIFSGKEICIHTNLSVLMCSECHSFYGDGSFSMDEDGDDKYCRWCGQGGTLFCCAACSCAFCKKCIKNNLNRKVLNDVEKDDWKCFICDPKPLYPLRATCWAANMYFHFVNRKEEKETKTGKREMCNEKEKTMKRKRGKEKSDSGMSDDSQNNLSIRATKKTKILNKHSEEKIIALSSEWITESVNDILDLGALMSESCEVFKKKYSIKTLKDVNIAFSKVNNMILKISKSIDDIKTTNNENFIHFTKLIGEDVETDIERNTENTLSTEKENLEKSKVETSVDNEKTNGDLEVIQSDLTTTPDNNEQSDLNTTTDNNEDSEIDNVRTIEGEDSKSNNTNSIENKNKIDDDCCEEDSEKTLNDKEVMNSLKNDSDLVNSSKNESVLDNNTENGSVLDNNTKNESVLDNNIENEKNTSSNVIENEKNTSSNEIENEKNTSSNEDAMVLKIEKDFLESSSESSVEDSENDINSERKKSKKKRHQKNSDKCKEKKAPLKDGESLKQDSEDDKFINEKQDPTSRPKRKDDSDSDTEIDKLTNLSRITKRKKRKCSESSDIGNEADHNNDQNSSEEKDKELSDSEKNVEEKSQKKKKEEKEDILDYLKEDDSNSSDNNDNDQSMPHDDISNLLSEEVDCKNIEEEQEKLNLDMLLASSGSEDGKKTEKQSSDSDLENLLTSKKDKKKTKDSDKIEKNGMEEELESKNKSSSESSFNSSDDLLQKELLRKKRRQKWRENKLLKTKFSDTDTSDEDRRWERIKKRRKAKQDLEISETDTGVKIKPKLLHESEEEEKEEEQIDKESSSLSLSSEEPISSSESEDEIITRKVKRKKASSSSAISISSEEEEKKKKKRKRIKSPVLEDDSSAEETLKEKSNIGESPGKGGRKNIRKLLDKTDLAKATQLAAKEEEERKRRMIERQKLFNECYEELKETKSIDKLILDFNPETKEELVSVHQNLVSKMKPHQAKGVKFMWDSCFESLKQLKNKKGSGCILAHCMGLGKTFQVVSLVHTLMNHEDVDVKTVLVVCPLSTVLNWYNEFQKWLSDIEDGKDIGVFHLTLHKQNFSRARYLKEWHDEGGVMILGYEMFRNLTTEGRKFKARVKNMFQESLVDPGPDLIVCDEGHMLKNETTALSKAMTKVRTQRRIVLTGTPLQNNLKEYHCMVQFVKPNLLGTRREFLNRFANPITNGQFVDSTDQDVRVMKRRAHVLHKMLEGIIQRFDYNVLTPFLPPKHEYVIKLRLSDVQIKLYQYYLEHYTQSGGQGTTGSRLFSDFQSLSRIWTHPHAVKMSTDKAEKDAQKKADLEDSEGSLRDFIDDSEGETSSSSSRSSSSSKSNKSATFDKDKPKSTRSTRNNPILDEPELEETKVETKDRVWWESLIEPDQMEDINQSAKFILLFSILRECELIGDKVLVFSQSLYSLNLIEYFLEKIDVATMEGKVQENLGGHVCSWSKGLDYFRLDGSTSSENRNAWCKLFNKEDNTRARLFLISTRAGGLGINLTGANRVVIFDASWNPSHDVQSIFRIYRFGQKKPCYIYRFIAQGTMEEKVYDRQIAKLSLSSRVVDEQQAHRHFSHNDLQELYTFSPKPKSEKTIPLLPKDKLMAELLKMCDEWIETYHEHDSLIEHVIGEELNEEERKLAWEDYEKEKQGLMNNQNQGNFGNIAFIQESLKRKFPSATEEQYNMMLYKMMQQVNNPQVAYQQQMQSYQQSLLQNQLLQQTSGQNFQQNQAIPFNKLQNQQIHNYQAQLAYQRLLQQNAAAVSLGRMGSNVGPQNTKQDATVTKPKSDSQNRKPDPEIVDLD